VYQVVTVYAGQRILHERGFRSVVDAAETAEGVFQDAPVEVVDERTGLLKGTVTERGWRATLRPTRREVVDE
jgi:hypothetical protein